MADTTLCLILNLYRRTYWLANMVSINLLTRDLHPYPPMHKNQPCTFEQFTPDTLSHVQVKEGKKITGPEQLKDAAFGCARIRGDTLGIVGLGKFHRFFIP